MQRHSLALQRHCNSVVTVLLQGYLFSVPIMTDVLTLLPAYQVFPPWKMTIASRWHLPGESYPNFLRICQRCDQTRYLKGVLEFLCLMK